MTDIDLDIFAGLKAGFGDLAAALRQERLDRLALVPIDADPGASDVMPAAGNLALNLGGPVPGRIWLLRQLVVGGLTWGTVAAGTAEAYGTALPPLQTASGRQLSDLADAFSALPGVHFYTSRQVVLRNPQRLVVVVVGGTSGQTYQAAANVEDYAVIPAAERYAL